MFTELWTWQQDLDSLYETPALPEDEDRIVHRDQAHAVIAAARAAGRTILAESESKAILAAYGIPITETRIAPDVDAAVTAAASIGYPVVLKLYSHTITHKTDVGGVKLNLRDEGQVREAFAAIRDAVAEKKGLEHFEGVTVQPMIDWAGYELIVGLVHRCPVRAGAAVRPGRPAGRGVQGPRAGPAAADQHAGPADAGADPHLRGAQGRPRPGCRGHRGPGAAPGALQRARRGAPGDRRDRHQPAAGIRRTGCWRWTRGSILHPADLPASKLPRPAIRPYPLQYAGTWTDRTGELFHIRPIRPEDETLLVDFHRTLSEQSIYQRYFENLGLDRRIAHERLIRVCFTDYDRELALVAEHRDPETGAPVITAVGRLSKLRDGTSAEFATLVSDRWQGRGIGTELLTRLIDVARREGLERIVAEILDTNGSMIRLSRKLGFTIKGDPLEGTLTMVLDLTKGLRPGPDQGSGLGPAPVRPCWGDDRRQRHPDVEARRDRVHAPQPTP